MVFIENKYKLTSIRTPNVINRVLIEKNKVFSPGLCEELDWIVWIVPVTFARVEASLSHVLGCFPLPFFVRFVT